jgi:hypothetical protein
MSRLYVDACKLRATVWQFSSDWLSVYDSEHTGVGVVVGRVELSPTRVVVTDDAGVNEYLPPTPQLDVNEAKLLARVSSYPRGLLSCSACPPSQQSEHVSLALMPPLCDHSSREGSQNCPVEESLLQETS